MFKIDPEKNQILPLQQRKFSDLGFRERQHLQEWIAGTPEAFGEELLIVQKEFDQFHDTSERLDLLALDKEGRLVLIENKLDDSGRDMVWQALKYTAYCSSLKTHEIVDIFRAYLDRYHDGSGSRATEILSEFLEQTDLDETVLNEGNGQRIILVAAQFRKEVTATVLWLLSQGISIQCFKVTPFSIGDQNILDVQQIIPVPEARDFMISMADKGKSEIQASKAQRRSHRIRLEFWTEALTALRSAGLNRYENINPTKDNWITCGTGVRGCHFTLVLSRESVRVQLNIETADREHNKAIFDALSNHRTQIEASFGSSLDWLRLDDNKVSRIVSSHQCDGFDRQSWPEMIQWLVTNRQQIESALLPVLLKVTNSE